MKFDLDAIERMKCLSAPLASRLRRYESHLREKAAAEVKAAERIRHALLVKPIDIDLTR